MPRYSIETKSHVSLLEGKMLFLTRTNTTWETFIGKPFFYGIAIQQENIFLFYSLN